VTEDDPFSHFFDAQFYRYQQAGSGSEGLDHFVSHGDGLGLDPGPYFSTSFYKSRYPDWRASGAQTALEDFLLRLAAGEGTVQPHPLIDPVYYRSMHPDLAGLGAEAVLHFVRHGDGERRRPSVGFDAGFYAKCYLPIGEGYPLRHYITEGKRLGFRPKPKPFPRQISKERMAGLTKGLTRPLVFVVHDAQKAGVPILTLDLADFVQSQRWQPVFLLLRAGPLLQEFQTRGPVAIIDEGWTIEGIADALPVDTPAILNTATVAGLGRALAQGGRRCLLLIHEMPQYLRDTGFIETLQTAQDAGVRLAVSMPRIVDAFEAELGRLPVLRPGITRPAVSRSGIRAVRRRLGGRLRGAPTFIGAGHGDHRKGFDLFLDAANAIVALHADARFVWLGTLDPWAQNLADAALAQGLDLILPGFVTDAAAWYLNASVYLLTSRQDPGPATVVHAAQMGTPFVGYAADIGLIGVAEVVGAFVPEGDKAAFVAAAVDALNQTAQYRRSLRRTVAEGAVFDVYGAQVLKAVTDR